MGACLSTTKVKETHQPDFPVQPAEQSFSQIHDNYCSFSLTPPTISMSNTCDIGSIPGQNTPADSPVPVLLDDLFRAATLDSSSSLTGQEQDDEHNKVVHPTCTNVTNTNEQQQQQQQQQQPQQRSRGTSDADDETARSLRNLAVERRLQILSITASRSRSTTPDKEYTSRSSYSTPFSHSIHRSNNCSPFSNQDVLDDVSHVVYTPSGRRTALALLKTFNNSQTNKPYYTFSTPIISEQPTRMEERTYIDEAHPAVVYLQPTPRYARKRSNGIDETQHAHLVALAQQKMNEEDLIDKSRPQKNVSQFLLRMRQRQQASQLMHLQRQALHSQDTHQNILE